MASAASVSVLMPIRCWRQWSDHAIRGVLAQTHRELELVLALPPENDPACPSLLDALADIRDSRLRLIHRPRPGIVAALNAARAAAQGDFLARMDDDDGIDPARISSQLNYLEQHPDIDFCALPVRFFSDSHFIMAGNRRYADWLNEQNTPQSIARHALCECAMPHPSWFAHREVWHRLGPYREFDGPEDYDLFLNAWLDGLRMGKADAPLHHWRDHESRLTRLDGRYRRETFIRLKAQAACDPRSGLHLSTGRGVWLIGVGRHAREWCDALSSRGVTVHGFVDLERTGAKQQFRHRPVIRYPELFTTRSDALVIIALGQMQARTSALHACIEAGLHWGDDVVLGV